MNLMDAEMEPVVGFSMGGQASAGGSTFYAGVRDYMFFARLPPPVFQETH